MVDLISSICYPTPFPRTQPRSHRLKPSLNLYNPASCVSLTVPLLTPGHPFSENAILRAWRLRVRYVRVNGGKERSLFNLKKVLKGIR
jgi:hypothetical protein